MAWNWLTGDPTQNLHGTTAYGQTYGGRNDTMQPAQPAVPPGGGGGPAPAVPPGGVGSSLFSTTPTRPANVNLTPEEQAAIIKSLGSGAPNGSFIVGGTATAQPKLGKNPVGADVLIDTGEYQITVQTPDGRTLPMTVTKSTDPGGNPSWIAEPPKDTTSATKATGPTDYVVKSGDGSAWYPDDINNPAGGYHKIVPAGVPNADDEIKKAVDRQVAEGDRNARARNEAATGIYGTDAEVAKIQNDAATQKLNKAELDEKIRQFNQQHKYDDQNQKIIDDKAASDLQTASVGRAATQATTEGTRATTAATTQATEIAAKKLPGELAQQGATLEATNIANQAAKAPTVQAPQTGLSIYQRNPLTGVVTNTGMNPEYMPKTQAEVQARIGQILNLQRQKQDEVQGKIGRTIDGKLYTADDASSEFNAWKAQNVDPQAGMLQAAQQDAAQKMATDLMAAKGTAYQQALGAGNQQLAAIKDYAAMNPVGNQDALRKAYGEVMQGKPPSDIVSANTYSAPNPMQAAQQGTMNALRYIDPTAAAATGAPPPNYGQMNIPQMLGANPYQAPGMPPGMQTMQQRTPAPAAPPAGPPAPGSQEWFDNIFRPRQQQSVDEQRAQALAMPFGTPPGTPPTPTLPTPPAAPNFGAIPTAPNFNFGGAVPTNRDPGFTPPWSQPAPNFGNPWSFAPPYTPNGYIPV